MPGKRSAIIHRIILVFSALAVVGIVIWVGMNVLEPVQVPLLLPPKAHVKFDPETDIRKNSLWETLKAFVIGDIEIGVVGKPNPFIGPSGEGQLSVGQVSRLATMEDVPLMGAAAIDIARGIDGSMLVLLSGSSEGSVVTYEVRSYKTNGEVVTFVSWTASADPSFLPATIAQDRNGRVWLGSVRGQVGYVEKDGEPHWLVGLQTGMSTQVVSMVIDGADRVWATDGLVVSVGGDQEFAPIDLMQQMSEADRIDFMTSLSELPFELQPFPLEGPDGLLRAALLPEQFSVTGDGRVGLSTGYSAFRFPLALQQQPEWTNTLAASSLALAVAPNGDVWGRRYTDDALLRIWATGTRAYESATAVPSQALRNPHLFTQYQRTFYAVDYAPTSTSVLWSTEGEEWLAQVIVASGTVPLDTPREAEVDGDRNVWLRMSQGGAVRIRRSLSITE